MGGAAVRNGAGTRQYAWMPGTVKRSMCVCMPGPRDPHQLMWLNGPIMATVTLTLNNVMVLVTVPGCMAQWHSLSLPGGPTDPVPLPASLWSQGEAQGHQLHFSGSPQTQGLSGHSSCPAPTTHLPGQERNQMKTNDRSIRS